MQRFWIRLWGGDCMFALSASVAAAHVILWRAGESHMVGLGTALMH